MLKHQFKIIPAIDIIDGKCVRLQQGDYDKIKIYDSNPLNVAKEFEDAGIKFLHLVDLDGAKAGQLKNLTVLESIATHTKLNIDFGGGIKNITSGQDVLNAGATRITVGSIAIKSKSIWQEMIKIFGNEKLFLGADVKDGKIAVNAWQEKTEVLLIDFITENVNIGITNIFITDISKDGLLQGPTLSLYQKICKQFNSTNIIASGGVHHINDIESLKNIGCDGVIIGKALYEKRISLAQLKPYL